MYSQQQGPSNTASSANLQAARGRKLARKPSDFNRTYQPPPCNCCGFHRRFCAALWALFSLAVTLVISSHFFMIVAIEKKKANYTMLDLLKKYTKWSFLQGVENPSTNTSDKHYCLIHDHPSFLPAAIRLSFLFMNIFGILLFIIAAVFDLGRGVRIFFIRAYMYLVYAPIFGTVAITYFKIQVCYENYLYWVMVFADMILTYAWALFGNEIARPLYAWVDDPEEVKRRDLERKGKVSPEVQPPPMVKSKPRHSSVFATGLESGAVRSQHTMQPAPAYASQPRQP